MWYFLKDLKIHNKMIKSIKAAEVFFHGFSLWFRDIRKNSFGSFIFLEIKIDPESFLGCFFFFLDTEFSGYQYFVLNFI